MLLSCVVHLATCRPRRSASSARTNCVQVDEEDQAVERLEHRSLLPRRAIVERVGSGLMSEDDVFCAEGVPRRRGSLSSALSSSAGSTLPPHRHQRQPRATSFKRREPSRRETTGRLLLGSSSYWLLGLRGFQSDRLRPATPLATRVPELVATRGWRGGRGTPAGE